MGEMVAIPQPCPYRWGRFQGWGLVLLGIIQTLTMLSVLYWPNNPFADGFFEASDPRLLNALRQDATTQSYRRFAGSVIGFVVVVFPLAVLILKKRMSLFFLIALNASKAAFQLNGYGIVFWIVCTVYYAKRRKELRWP